jgi:1,4-dihydroxy-2-naphthoate octaprenyltransferase
MIMKLLVYMRAARLPFLTGSFFPVAVAAALAYLHAHTFNFLLFGLTALGVAVLQCGANMINDYYDAFGSDPINRNVTPFSGGSRVIQNGQMTPAAVKTMAMRLPWERDGLTLIIWAVPGGDHYIWDWRRPCSTPLRRCSS